MRGRSNSERSSRVNSDVQRVIGHIIEFELKDPGISGLTSVVKTEVTKDLKIYDAGNPFGDGVRRKCEC